MNKLTCFKFSYICMNKFNVFFYFYKYYFVDFSRMVIDTELKFSAYTYTLMAYRMMYHTLL